jgi:hypothetical protein
MNTPGPDNTIDRLIEGFLTDCTFRDVLPLSR